MRAIPEGLVVDADDGGVHVELGPPPPRMITFATVVSVIFVSALIVLATYFGLPAIAVALAVVGVVGVATLRIVEFGRNEAALTLTTNERALTLTRHYRGRIFRSDRYPLERIGGCSAIQDGLKLELPGGAIWLKTRFRSFEQNAWVADMVCDALQKRRDHDGESRDSSAIDALVDAAPYRT